MATNSGPITELVRIPLAVPFQAFLSIFAEQLEPVLLAQNGIISIITGVMIPIDTQNGTYAVSITQWESMEAHGAFLESPAAKPFFETLGPLAKGPPAIEHYSLGLLTSTALQSQFAYVSLVDSRGSTTQRDMLDKHLGKQRSGKRAGATGRCIEVEGQSALMLFRGTNEFQAGSLPGEVASFVIRVERSQAKATASKPTLANI